MMILHFFQVYRQLGDVGTVWSLQELRGIEDKKLLSGKKIRIAGRNGKNHRIMAKKFGQLVKIIG